MGYIVIRFTKDTLYVWGPGQDRFHGLSLLIEPVLFVSLSPRMLMHLKGSRSTVLSTPSAESSCSLLRSTKNTTALLQFGLLGAHKHVSHLTTIPYETERNSNNSITIVRMVALEVEFATTRILARWHTESPPGWRRKIFPVLYESLRSSADRMPLFSINIAESQRLTLTPI